MSLNCSGQIYNGGTSLSKPSWARGPCTRGTGPSGLLSQLQYNNLLDGLGVERGFRLKNFLVRDVDPLGCYQLCQRCRVVDTSRALSNSMVNVEINPTTNVDFQALFNVVKEHRPFLGHLRSMHSGHKSATYKVVLDFHILLEVLGREMGMLVPHYSPPSIPPIQISLLTSSMLAESIR